MKLLIFTVLLFIYIEANNNVNKLKKLFKRHRFNAIDYDFSDSIVGADDPGALLDSNGGCGRIGQGCCSDVINNGSPTDPMDTSETIGMTTCTFNCFNTLGQKSIGLGPPLCVMTTAHCCALDGGAVNAGQQTPDVGTDSEVFNPNRGILNDPGLNGKFVPSQTSYNPGSPYLNNYNAPITDGNSFTGWKFRFGQKGSKIKYRRKH